MKKLYVGLGFGMRELEWEFRVDAQSIVGIYSSYEEALGATLVRARKTYSKKNGYLSEKTIVEVIVISDDLVRAAYRELENVE